MEMTLRTFLVAAVAALALAAPPWPAWSGAPGQPAARTAVAIPGGNFMPQFGADPGAASVDVPPFRLDSEPVTNSQFFRFTVARPEWAPERVAPQFADARYLSHWSGGPGFRRPAPWLMDLPVTYVSWHAADAYCRAQGGALPTTFQWELAAAADQARADARLEPAFSERILAWYSRPFALEDLSPDRTSPPNFYGVRGLHGLVWEWVDDFDSPRFAGAGGRGEGDPMDRFCGAGAYGAQGTRDYAAFMRFALRSSLQAHYTSPSLGFRCAYPAAD